MVKRKRFDSDMNAAAGIGVGLFIAAAMWIAFFGAVKVLLAHPGLVNF
jgi:hypothetical protein